MSSPATLLTILLRVAGGFMLLAFLAAVMPTDWMAATHEWLGLGAFPRVPIVDYLTRSVAGLYGFHGALLLVVSRDPVRFRPIVVFLAVMNVLFGFMLVAIDVHAGLPAVWTILEGLPIMAFGVVIGVLLKHLPEPPARQ